MRPIKILGIAPYEGIASLMRQAAESRDDLQIDVHVGNLTAGAEIAAAQTAQEEYDASSPAAAQRRPSAAVQI